MKVLVVIDMQNDFIDGALGTKEAEAIVPGVVERIRNSKNELILFTYDTHQEDYLDTPEGQKLPVIHCVEGTDGWQLGAGILAAWQDNGQTIRMEKPEAHMYRKPVFGSVALMQYLVGREEEITEIELIGVCTDICVVSNALMIKNSLPNVKISVDATLCAGVTPESHLAALQVLEMCQVEVKRG